MASTPSTEANQPPNAPAQAKTQRRVVSVNAEASTPNSNAVTANSPGDPTDPAGPVVTL
jgi:hypothetical protein